MGREEKPRLSLDQTAAYAITIPGVIEFGPADWADGLEVAYDHESYAIPATILSGEFDQAALHGLLRRLYSVGLPLISVVWLKGGNKPQDQSFDGCAPR